MNKVYLVGTLTRDLELFETTNGKKYTTIDIATKDGSVTDYVRVKVWNILAENCVKYLSKGKKVAMSGKLSTFQKDTEDKKIYELQANITEVEFLTSKNDPPSNFDQRNSVGQEVEEDLPF